MNHEMNLGEVEFNLLKSGRTNCEIRLYDVKRRALKLNDIITFNNRVTNEKIDVVVKKLEVFDNQEELFKTYNFNSLGLSEEVINYYSLEEIEKYGLLLITFVRN